MKEFVDEKNDFSEVRASFDISRIAISRWPTVSNGQRSIAPRQNCVRVAPCFSDFFAKNYRDRLL